MQKENDSLNQKVFISVRTILEMSLGAIWLLGHLTYFPVSTPVHEMGQT